MAVDVIAKAIELDAERKAAEDRRKADADRAEAERRAAAQEAFGALLDRARRGKLTKADTPDRIVETCGHAGVSLADFQARVARLQEIDDAISQVGDAGAVAGMLGAASADFAGRADALIDECRGRLRELPEEVTTAASAGNRTIRAIERLASLNPTDADAPGVEAVLALHRRLTDRRDAIVNAHADGCLKARRLNTTKPYERIPSRVCDDDVIASNARCDITRL